MIAQKSQIVVNLILLLYISATEKIKEHTESCKLLSSVSSEYPVNETKPRTFYSILNHILRDQLQLHSFDIRAASWQNKQNGMCAQRRLISAWASAQSLISLVDAQADLSVRWALMPFCWFCHEAAHLPVLHTCTWTTIRIAVFVLRSNSLYMFRDNLFAPSRHLQKFRPITLLLFYQFSAFVPANNSELTVVIT